MIISIELDVSPKQADDLASEVIANLIEDGIEVLGYEVTT